MVFRDFIDSRRTEATRTTYEKLLRMVLSDPDRFADLASKDRKAAEGFLIKRVVELRERIAPTSLNVSVAVVKSFLDYADIQLNWKRVRSVAPPGRTVALDRAPTTEEIRAGLKLSSLREKVAILIMASGGLRVGALPGLRLKDLRFLDSGLGRITVYAGEQGSQYTAFITPEAVEAVKDYLEFRENDAGEELTPDSPLFRDKWDYQGAKRRVNRVVSEVPRPVKAKAIFLTINRLWQRAGVRKARDGRPWKSDHGLRKWFKTSFPAWACQQHGELDVEVLMGHFLSYHKPTPEHLEEVYLRAVPSLSIDEKYKLKEEIATKDKEHSAKWQETRLENLEMKERIQNLEKRTEDQDATLRSVRQLLELMQKEREAELREAKPKVEVAR